MSILRMADLVLSGKRVLIREDLNVPIKDNVITNDTRIRVAIPTIKRAINANAKVMILSHLGRPIEGVFDREHSLAAVAARLSDLLGQEVPIIHDWLDGVEIEPGQAVLCENVRFNSGEKENSEALSKKMAKLCDIYVMDAFATAHRSEASTCGITQFAPAACAGPLLEKELNALHRGFEEAKSPIIAIVGGSKVSTKLKVLESLSKKIDTLIVGGGIANTFIAAEGHDVGRSLYEADFLDEAERLTKQAHHADIPLPVDVIVADELSDEADSFTRDISLVGGDEKILDIGPATTKQYAKLIKEAGTILWNGPLGVFEIKQFSKGTKAIAQAIAQSDAFSIAGGGDTIAAIDQFGIADKISYISTGGGAFLSFLEGKPLPAVKALEQYAKDTQQ
jgi:phosphoglycerate kinase